MGIFEITLISIGLAMDAFSVSICLGLQSADVSGAKKYLTPAIYFGFFQAIMPVIGYFSGIKFLDFLNAFGHYIAFCVLFLIGLNMIKESREKADCNKKADFSHKKMLLLAVATSIDALATGVSFAFLKADIFLAAVLIGLTTFFLSLVGVKTGTIFGDKYKSKAEISGGVILILIGVKILIENLAG